MRELADVFNHPRLSNNQYERLADMYLLYCCALPVERIALDSKQICEDNTETLGEYCCEEKIDTATAIACYFAPPICCLTSSGLFCGVCVASGPMLILTTCGLFGYNTIKTGYEACLTNPEPEQAAAAPAQQQMDDQDIAQLAEIDRLLHWQGQPFTLG